MLITTPTTAGPRTILPETWPNVCSNALLLCSIPHRNFQRIARIFAPIHATRASTLPQQGHSNYVYFAISFTFINKYTFILSLIYKCLTCFVSLYFTLKIYLCQMDFKFFFLIHYLLVLFSFLSWIFLVFMISSFPQFCILHSYTKCYKCGSELNICISLAKWEIFLTLIELSHWNGPT